MTKVVSWKDIPYSKDLQKSIKAMPKGVVMAVRMKHVNSSELPKVQIEFAEKIGAQRVQNAVSFFNSDDDRFSSGAQRCWITSSIEIATKEFGEIPEGEASVEINKLMTKDIDGQMFRLQHIEDVESNLTESEMDYADNYLKRAGKDGNYFYTPEGERVISRNSLVQVPVGEEVEHVYLKGTFRSESKNNPLLKVSSDLAEASK
jgi:hypothetical protein